MDPQTIIQSLGVSLLALLCYLGREVRTDVKEMKSRLHKVEGGQSLMLGVMKIRGLMDPDQLAQEEDYHRPAQHKRRA